MSFSACFTRSSPEMSLGSSASRSQYSNNILLSPTKVGNQRLNGRESIWFLRIPEMPVIKIFRSEIARDLKLWEKAPGARLEQAAG
jgi:hypothetical protein